MAALSCPLILNAQDNQAATRQNPTVETGNLAAAETYPAYINLKANRIDMNGADWSDLVQVFAASDSCPVTIVHIGDSHLQADMGTAVTRRRLGSELGGLRGRGLIIPFRLAGTNQPVDYQITSTSEFKQSRLLKTPWPTAMGFTGIAIEPVTEQFDLTVTTREPFESLTVYFTGDTLALVSAGDSIQTVAASTESVAKGMKITFDNPMTEVRLDLLAPLGTAIHGINASAGETGLAYHVIGNNGAAFSSYTDVGSVGTDVSEMLEPDLIIVSLGTNEAFNAIGSDEFRATVDRFIKEITAANPDARLLLVTPQECHRKVTRRRRRRTRVSYQINANVKRMRDIILEYARTEGIPVYDWYTVSGGDNASHSWIKDRLINTDHIHLTMAGYRLQGNLFTDALLSRLKP